MSSLQFSPAVARWLAQHHGVGTASELHALGLGRTALERLCRLGVLLRVTRGVYVLATHASSPTLEHRCRLLCALHPSGFITGPTMGMLENVRRMPAAALLHFSVCHGNRLDKLDGVKYRQTTKLRADDRRVRDDGIVVGSWPRFAFDIAADLSPLDHRSVIHQLLDKRRVTPEELAGVGERLCHPARRGTTTWRLSMVEIGIGIHDSHPEVELGDALLKRGIPIEAQVVVARNDGIELHLDLAVSEVRWGVELDIHPDHRTIDGHRRDSRRVRSLHGRDWQIEPVSELDMRSVDELADELAELYRDRAKAIRGWSDPMGGRPNLRRV